MMINRAQLAFARCLGCALLFFGRAFAVGEVSITQGGDENPYTENFNGMGTTVPSGFRIYWGTANGGGTVGSPVNYGANVGSNTSPSQSVGVGSLTAQSSYGAYNFASGSDHSLGFLSSGNAAWGSNYGASILFGFTNNTGTGVSSIDLEWNYEKYRTGIRAFNFNFYFSTDGKTWTSYADGSQSYVGNSDNAGIVNQSLNKNITLDLEALGVSLGDGENFYFRWEYAGVGGTTNGQALAIDDFKMALTAAGPVLDDTVITPAESTVSMGRVIVNVGTDVQLDKTGTRAAGYEATTSGSVSVDGETAFSGSIAGNSANLSVAFTQTGAQSGSITIHNTATSSAGPGQGNLDPDDTITISGTAVTDREITATSHDFGNVLEGFSGTFSTTLSTTGSDDEYTRVTVAGNSVSGNGVTVSSGTDTVFNGAYVTTTRDVTVTFGDSAVNPTTVGANLATVGEGLAGEVVSDVRVTATANVFQASKFYDDDVTLSNNSVVLSSGDVAYATYELADANKKRASVEVTVETAVGQGWTVDSSNVGLVINEADIVENSMTFDDTGKLNGTHLGTLVTSLKYADSTLKGNTNVAPLEWTYSATVTGRVASTGVATVLAGNSYAGFGLTNVGTRATEVALLAGTASSSRDITMTFESLSGVTNDSLRVSDIVNLTGTATDLIVLQISFNPADYSEELAVAWLAGNQWVVANAGNSGNTALGMQYQGFLGSFAEFQAGVIGSGAMADYLGAYGVDASGNAWAIVNHNSEFAVVAVPEPGTYALIAIAGVVFMIFRRRNKLANS